MITFFHLECFGIAREGLRCMSARDDSIVHVGDGAVAGDFLQAIGRQPIDVLLLDVHLQMQTMDPLSACFELCQGLRRDYPDLNIVLHSPYTHAAWMRRFIDLGVKGFVSKNSMHDQVVAAFRAVSEGRIFICPEIARHFSNYEEFLKNPRVTLKLNTPGFSRREIDVLDLLLNGNTTKKIAESLYISEKTVETHRKNLVQKAQVKNTAELVRFVSMKGLSFQ